MKKSFKFVALISMMLFSSTLLFAPPGDPDPPGGGDPPVGGAGVPLDGGSLLLLIAGASYGIKTLRNKKKKE